jgi:hypothetical protein
MVDRVRNPDMEILNRVIHSPGARDAIKILIRAGRNVNLEYARRNMNDDDDNDNDNDNDNDEDNGGLFLHNRSYVGSINDMGREFYYAYKYLGGGSSL